MKRLIIVLILLVSAPTWGWWPQGHSILTRAAVRALPQNAPSFLTAGEVMIAHCALDPQIAKSRGTVHLEKAGHPNHYFDLELLKGETLPASRYEFGRLCAKLETTPERLGMLPYVAAEWTEQLALAFAEHRKWPDNPFIQSKCVVYAGQVAHYAQELCQPLNLTIYWNGRENGKPANKRMHEKIDSMIQELNLKADDLATGQEIGALDSLMAGIFEQIQTGNGQVDEALALESDLASKKSNEWGTIPKLVDFATVRGREAVRFTVVLWMTAWEQSARIRLPGYIDRSKLDLVGAQ